MHLTVCLKQILDPELPPSEFRLDSARRQAAPSGAPLVTSIFDQNALEVALQLREQAGEGKITALSLGPASATDTLRRALSLRADEAIRLREEEFPGELDGYAAARLLAAAIRKLTPAVDIVFCGREAGDWHGGQMGAFLAAELGFGYLSLVSSVRREGGALRLVRQADDAREVFEAQPPLVLTVTNDEGNVPRLPKVKDNMLAFRKVVPEWGAGELGVDPSQLAGPNAGLELLGLEIPKHERQCQMIEGEDPAQRAAELVRRLAELQVI
jgi:electron transfer flavoprotein beta subunit